MPSPDINEPLADRGHESLRQSVVRALAESADNATGVGDAYFLADLLFSLVGDVQTAVEALSARVTALENPTP